MTNCVFCLRTIEPEPRYSTEDGEPVHMLCLEGWNEFRAQMEAVEEASETATSQEEFDRLVAEITARKLGKEVNPDAV
jgi:hypothetical protein